jgi:hypothetical protein
VQGGARRLAHKQHKRKSDGRHFFVAELKPGLSDGAWTRSRFALGANFVCEFVHDGLPGLARMTRKTKGHWKAFLGTVKAVP